MTIAFATKNSGKLKEIKDIIGADSEFDIVAQVDLGIHTDVAEDGGSYETNALKKAVEIADACHILTLADDSGLEVYCLNNEPGINSARYLGRNTPHDVKMAGILERMKDVPDEKRGARFVCAIAAVFPNGGAHIERAVFSGRIARSTRFGANGFGYDPIFIPEGYDVTVAELPQNVKNKISHRAKALRQMMEYLSASDNK
jgi:XTP/dITP diphosphohydrolase